jgi:hypothetical protein
MNDNVDLTPSEVRVIEAFRARDRETFIDLFDGEQSASSTVTERANSSPESDEPFVISDHIRETLDELGYNSDDATVEVMLNVFRLLAHIEQAKLQEANIRARLPAGTKTEILLRLLFPSDEETLRETGEKLGKSASTILRANREVLKFFGFDMPNQAKRKGRNKRLL